MRNYDICYLNDDGTVSATFSANCRDEQQAKILAHAMKLNGFQRMEVWDGQKLVYQRPLRAA
jgi:hypothetical protein